MFFLSDKSAVSGTLGKESIHMLVQPPFSIDDGIHSRHPLDVLHTSHSQQELPALALAIILGLPATFCMSAATC